MLMLENAQLPLARTTTLSEDDVEIVAFVPLHRDHVPALVPEDNVQPPSIVIVPEPPARVTVSP
jgi:hypothetical protein